MVSAISLCRDFGFHLLPVLADKRPACKWKPLQTRRASIGLVKSWMTRGLGLGVCTGRGSRLVVVDTDDQAAEDWVATNLPETPWMVRSGVKADGFRGRHRYYRYPSGVRVSNSAGVLVGRRVLKVDVRADGGYVVAPGSPHASGVSYEASRTWCPSDDVPTFDVDWFQRAQTRARRSSPSAPESNCLPTQTGTWIDALQPSKLARVAALLGVTVESLILEAQTPRAEVLR